MKKSTIAACGSVLGSLALAGAAVPALATTAEPSAPPSSGSSYTTVESWSTDTKVVTDATTETGAVNHKDPEGLGGSDSEEGEESEPEGSGDDDEAATDAAGCEVADSVSADQVIRVDGQGGAKASLTTCQRGSDGAFDKVGAFDARVGYNGIAAAGAKKEGDGKTPSGVFGLSAGFGVKDRPSQFPSQDWTKVTRDHVWVDGSASKEQGYNSMQLKSEGFSGESLFQTPAYDYAQVIDFNTERTPGAGSAIFLHVHTGSGKTAGCVSLSEADLLKVFDWQDDGAVIEIVR